jgi:hypothetical protein
MAAPLVTRSFTVDEYHRMLEAGILGEDDRVELLGGQVVEMTPIGPRHARCVDGLASTFSRCAGDMVTVRIQNPLVLGVHEEPEPDLALVVPRPGRYGDAHPGPGDVLLVVEVVESSLARDRDLKLPIYAAALQIGGIHTGSPGCCCGRDAKRAGEPPVRPSQYD